MPIIFKDCTPPTMVSNDEVNTTLGTNGKALISPDILLETYNDNCSPTERLLIKIWHKSFGEIPNKVDEILLLPNFLLFDCNQLGSQVVKCFILDEAGNWNVGEINVNIQDNTNICNTISSNKNPINNNDTNGTSCQVIYEDETINRFKTPFIFDTNEKELVLYFTGTTRSKKINLGINYLANNEYPLPYWKSNLKVGDQTTISIFSIQYLFTINSFNFDTGEITLKIEKCTNSSDTLETNLIQDKIFTDPRDNQTYKTITIGNQTWFAQNLNYKTKDSWCYLELAEFCDKAGRLYTWEVAKTACPKGWYLPSDTEWKTLLDNSGGTGTQAFRSLIQGGNSNFSALLSGKRFARGEFNGLEKIGYYWSATERDSVYSWSYGFSSNVNKVNRYHDYDKTDGLSCRCIKD